MKKVTASAMKHANALNYYRVRGEMTKKKSIRCKCSRCSNPKTCGHTIEYKKTREFGQKFTEEILAELIKNKPGDINHKELFNMIEDILIHLEAGDEEECVTIK